MINPTPDPETGKATRWGPINHSPLFFARMGCQAAGHSAVDFQAGFICKAAMLAKNIFGKFS